MSNYSNDRPASNYQQPPFQGAPPLPAGYNLNNQQWQSGRWSYNPQYNPNQPTASNQVSWAVAAAWRQMQPGFTSQSQHQQQYQHQYQHQQQQAINPYKRVPKPFNEDYYRQALSENPLGLTDMIPIEELESQLPPQSPWIWTPALVDDTSPASDEATLVSQPSPERRKKSSRHKSRQSSEPVPVSHASAQGRTSRASRHAASPALDIYAKPGSSHTVFNHPDSANLSRDSLPQFAGSLDRPRHASFSSSTSTRRSLDNAPQTVNQHDHASVTPPGQESFTSKMELKPTFSPNIVRTPQYYASRETSSRSTPANDPQVSQLSNRFERVAISSASAAAQSLTRHSSLPQPITDSNTNSITGANQYVDEPTSLLSPLSFTTPHLGSIRSVPRHSSAPLATSSSLSSIPERQTPAPRFLQPVEPPYMRVPSRAQSRSESRAESRASSRPTSRPSSQQPSPTSTSSSSTSRYSSTTLNTTPPSSTHSNSIPIYAPPQSSASAAAAVLSVSFPARTSSAAAANGPPVGFQAQTTSPPRPEVDSFASTQGLSRQTPPSPYKGRRRLGFWNKRGDHLTPWGEIVYALEAKSYPKELRHYPKEEEGYLNEHGWFVKYDDNRQEFLDSLPRRGKPPIRPYESFIRHETVSKP